MKLATMMLFGLLATACGSREISHTLDRVDPGEVRGTLTVRQPNDITLPNCPYDFQYYTNTAFYVYKPDTTAVLTGNIGSSVLLPEGAYKVVINETYVDVNIVRGHETSIKAGRAEVSDVNGSWYISGHNIWGGSAYALTSLHTGCGVNLAPAVYTLHVSYLQSAVNYQVDLTD